MSRSQLLDTISNAEFVAWLALQSIDPFFDGWQANAINCQTTAAIAGNRVSADKFLPIKPKRKQSPREFMTAMKRRAKKQNGPDTIT